MASLSNVYLIVNLGCEMVYVIDQRLKAQNIPLDKSAQVLRDITFILLDPKFFDYLLVAFNGIISHEQAKILMADITNSSVMRLDETSMNKLWELMLMILKWQLFLTKSPQNLMDITFKHLDGVARLLPEMRKSILIDSYKQILIQNWDILSDTDQQGINKTLNKWLKPFNTKISILIRQGLQNADAQFVMDPNNEFFVYYANHLGENIYVKSAFSSKSLMKNMSTPSLNADTSKSGHEIDQLSNQLGLTIQPSKSTGAIRKQNVNNYLFMHTNITNRTEDAEAKDAENVTITETSFTRTSESGNLARNLEEFMEKLRMTETASSTGQKTTENVKKVTFEKDDTELN